MMMDLIYQIYSQLLRFMLTTYIIGAMYTGYAHTARDIINETSNEYFRPM